VVQARLHRRQARPVKYEYQRVGTWLIDCRDLIREIDHLQLIPADDEQAPSSNPHQCSLWFSTLQHCPVKQVQISAPKTLLLQRSLRLLNWGVNCDFKPLRHNQKVLECETRQFKSRLRCDKGSNCAREQRSHFRPVGLDSIRIE